MPIGVLLAIWFGMTVADHAVIAPLFAPKPAQTVAAPTQGTTAAMTQEQMFAAR